MKADDTKAVVAVVNADTKRLALLEECDRLQSALEQNKATESDEERLKEVSKLASVIYEERLKEVITKRCLFLQSGLTTLITRGFLQH